MHDEDYLAHHGIKGQRWGIRRTPEQLGHKPVKKRENKIKKLVEETAKKKQAERVSEKNQSEEERHEKLKEYLRKHPAKMPQLGKELSRSEVDEIMSNVELDRRLKDIRRDEIQRGFRKINDIRTNVNAVVDLAKAGKEAYNLTADIYNTFVESGVANGPKWTKIGGNKPEVSRVELLKLMRTGKPEDVYENFDKLTKAEQDEYIARQKNKERAYAYTEAGKAEANAREAEAKSKNDNKDRGKQLKSVDGSPVEKDRFEYNMLMAARADNDELEKEYYRKAKEENPAGFMAYLDAIGKKDTFFDF